MGYITVDVDIDYDDLEVDDLIDALEDKMEKAIRLNKPKMKKDIQDRLTEILDYDVEPVVFTDFPNSVTEDLTVKVLKVLAKKYTLEELETLANK
jgi:hypothetical protein